MENHIAVPCFKTGYKGILETFDREGNAETESVEIFAVRVLPENKYQVSRVEYRITPEDEMPIWVSENQLK